MFHQLFHCPLIVREFTPSLCSSFRQPGSMGGDCGGGEGLGGGGDGGIFGQYGAPS